MSYRLPTIRVTKVFSFSMAHALTNHDGLCKNLHGHTYSLEITVAGKPLEQPGHPKAGMVADFADIKAIVTEKIISQYDHSAVINIDDKDKYGINDQNTKVHYTNFSPTCEMLLTHFVHMLHSAFPENISLQTIRLVETPTSWAEWHAEENR